MHRALVSGPAGRLEVERIPAEPDADASRQAILCHPHPHYGGSMHDGVLDVLTAGLTGQGIDVTRFNFRGVGHSEGDHDHGIGEIDDLRCVHSWLRNEFSLAPEDVLLGGYSFGSRVAWAAAPELAPAAILLVAPPIPAMEFAPTATNAPVHVLAGDADAFIERPPLEAWCETVGARLTWIRGADHFLAAAPAGLAAALPNLR